MKYIKLLLSSVLCLFISGCTDNKLEYYENNKPKLDLRSFFSGDFNAWGGIYDFRGKLTRTFHIKMKGTWQGNEGLLEEWFSFDDGEKLERTWKISFKNDNMFIGNANDVIGEAIGNQKGNAVNVHYTLRIPYDGKTLDLKMDDWMYLVEDNVMLNRTSMKKFGLKVGEIVIFMKH